MGFLPVTHTSSGGGKDQEMVPVHDIFYSSVAHPPESPSTGYVTPGKHVAAALPTESPTSPDNILIQYAIRGVNVSPILRWRVPTGTSDVRPAGRRAQRKSSQARASYRNLDARCLTVHTPDILLGLESLTKWRKDLG
jgi:hypothetical protein